MAVASPKSYLQWTSVPSRGVKNSQSLNLIKTEISTNFNESHQAQKRIVLASLHKKGHILYLPMCNGDGVSPWSKVGSYPYFSSSLFYLFTCSYQQGFYSMIDGVDNLAQVKAPNSWNSQTLKQQKASLRGLTLLGWVQHHTVVWDVARMLVGYTTAKFSLSPSGSR